MMRHCLLAELFAAWARGRLNDPATGVAEVKKTLATLVDQGSKLARELWETRLAELEAEAVGVESALARVNEALALTHQGECRYYLSFLHRVRGDLLLKRDPVEPSLAEEAFGAAIAVAKEQGARSYRLQAALRLAKLYRSTGRPVEAHAALAPALQGFSPTPEMPEIGEAQLLLGALAETEEVKAAEAQRQRRLHLQTAYGQAMMWAKGFSAEEASAAFSRATELAAKTDTFADRFAAGHFQWSFAYLRGELQSARELELSFLKEAEDTSRVVEAGVARRGLALACYQAADFLEARIHCERALEACDAKSERETQERFQDATGPLVVSVLAVTMWQLGEVERARELIEQANRRGSELGYGPSMAHPLMWRAHLEILRGDAAAALSASEALDALGRDRELPFLRTDAGLSAGWARGRLHDNAAGVEDLRRVLADRAHLGVRYNTWFYNGLLAELEAETLGAEHALARIDEAFALARQVENRCNLPFPHLLRGKLLLECDPSNPAPAEEAFQTAFEIAKQQGARSWGLRAALSLAKLYQSTNRPIEAHDVLVPALEGFASTPEMPEIAEAEALLATLAEMGEVKAATAQRQRRLHLQTSYGQAVMYSSGFGAEETKAAFAQAAELATKSADFSARFGAAHGQWTTAFIRCEFQTARELASAFLREAEDLALLLEASVARRGLALISYFLGNFLEARTHCEKALDACDPQRDQEARERFGDDTGTLALSLLAATSWQLGEVDRARELIDAARRRATELGHFPSMAHPLAWRWNIAVVKT
jgi:tetratricopeptide (TPR) repeat protein